MSTMSREGARRTTRKSAANHPVKAAPPPGYNTAAIRRLLTEALSDDEFTDLCADYFLPVYDNFAGGLSRAVKTRLLLDYCRQRGQFGLLLDLVRELNPYQYEQMRPALTASPLPLLSNKPGATRYSRIEITVGGDFDGLPAEKLHALERAIAGVLADESVSDVNQFHILSARLGSMIMDLLVPTTAAERLQQLANEQDGTVPELGIQSMRMRGTQMQSIVLQGAVLENAALGGSDI
jgi:hypothetical protein